MQRLNWMKLLPLLVFLGIAVVLGSGLFTSGKKSVREAPIVGQQIPQFSLPLATDAGAMFMPKTWAGQVALLNVFASWCEPCKVEHPLFIKLAQEQKLPLFAVAWRDNAAKVQQYLAQHGNPFAAVGVDSSGTTTVPLGITGIPTSYLIDKKGIVRWKWDGPLDEATIQQILLPLVEQLRAGN